MKSPHFMTWKDRDVRGGSRDLIGYGPHPPKVVWPENARVVVSLVLNYEEGAEYSLPAGDESNEELTEHFSAALTPPYRDLAAESVFEYGSRAGVWRLLQLFERYGLQVTVFAAAVALLRNPAVSEWIVNAGHEVCAHGWRWSKSWLKSREEEKEELAQAVYVLESLTKQRPRGWYSRYGPSVHTRELLIEDGGFIYDSDAYNDDLPYFVSIKGKRHLVIPYTKIYNDIRFVLPQGFGHPSAFFETCSRALDYLWEEGEDCPKMMSVGVHARLMGQAARTDSLREFIEYALKKPAVRFMRRIDIADWWLNHYTEF